MGREYKQKQIASKETAGCLLAMTKKSPSISPFIKVGE